MKFKAIREHKKIHFPFVLLICINNPFKVWVGRKKKKQKEQTTTKTSKPCQRWETGQEATVSRVKGKPCYDCFLHGDKKDQSEALKSFHCSGQVTCSVIVLGCRVKPGFSPPGLDFPPVAKLRAGLCLPALNLVACTCSFTVTEGYLQLLLTWSFPPSFCGPSFVAGFWQDTPRLAWAAAGTHPVCWTHLLG